jgi:hypothetical protein
MIVGLISDQTLITINTIELLGIVYLAIAVSRLRARIAFLEGRLLRDAPGEREEKEQ